LTALQRVRLVILAGQPHRSRGAGHISSVHWGPSGTRHDCSAITTSNRPHDQRGRFG
jgi:hypothetical protein